MRCNDFMPGLEVAPCRKEKGHKSGHIYSTEKAWEVQKNLAVIHLEMSKSHAPCKHAYCSFCNGYDVNEILWEND